MAKYAVNNTFGGSQQNMSTSFKSLTSLTAATATLRRAWINEISIGPSDVPNATDCSYVFDVSRQTSLGTGTSATSAPLDSLDAAAGTVATVNYTVEPTVTASTELFSMGLNQRASFRWVAVPGFELVIPATNVNGIVGRAKSTNYASTMICDMKFYE